MISKEKFISLLKQYEDFSKLEKQLEDMFKSTALYESPLFELPNLWFEDLLKNTIKPDQIDIVSAYIWPEDVFIEMWDRKENPLKLYDESDNLTDSIATYEDLYNFLIKNNGFCTNN